MPLGFTHLMTYYTISQENIKALHSNNFIPPIIQEIKNPILNNKNIIKTYDDILNKLSLSRCTKGRLKNDVEVVLAMQLSHFQGLVSSFW